MLQAELLLSSHTHLKSGQRNQHTDRPQNNTTKDRPTWISSKVCLPEYVTTSITLTDLFTDWGSYLLSSNNPFRPYILPFLSYTSIIKAYTAPLLNAVTQKPDLATLALLLVIIFLSLKILNMLVSTIMFWIRLASKVVFWGSLAILGLWMWTRGPEGVMEDVGHWSGIWAAEYKHFTDSANQNMARGNQQPYGGGAGSGWN